MVFVLTALLVGGGRADAKELPTLGGQFLCATNKDQATPLQVSGNGR